MSAKVDESELSKTLQKINCKCKTFVKPEKCLVFISMLDCC